MCSTCAMVQTPGLNEAAAGRLPPADPKAVEAFAGRLVGMVNDAAVCFMISLGHRTGLFDAMSDGRWHTSSTLAESAGLSERYVREWLGAMTCGRIVEHDRDAVTYRLPAEHAAKLTRAATPSNLAQVMQWLSVMGSVEDDVLAAFEHGRGVPYSAYRRFNDVMADESSQSVVAALDGRILPLVPGIEGRLEAGIDVLDVGCGEGKALLHLAGRFPNSRFVGRDLLPEAVAVATAHARQSGLSNVRFECADVSLMTDEQAFDLVTTFDAIHDQAKPDVVLTAIRRALRAEGVYLCQEIRAETAHADNLDNPLGAFVYAISTMHCMSVSLAQGGRGLGAAWGRTLCHKYLTEAGFDDVVRHDPPEDPMNDFYICRL